LVSKVANVLRSRGREMLSLLLRGTVVPALPVTACMLSATALAEGWRTGDGVEVLGNVLVIVLFLPFVVWGGFRIARAWTRAAEAVQPADDATSGAPDHDGRPDRRVWRAYLAGVLFLLVVAAAVPYVISDNAAPIDLGNIPVAGFVVSFAGPLGFLSPIALLASRTAGNRFRAIAGPSLARAWLLVAVLVAVGYSFLVGFFMFELTDVVTADGIVAPIAVVGELLTFPLPILLISVGSAVWPGILRSQESN
jgi:hypothetical protein